MPTEAIVISRNWEELRRFMWDYVGIVRTNKRLQRAFRIRLPAREIDKFYSHFLSEKERKRPRSTAPTSS